MREAFASLVAKHGRQAGVYLAWQCHQVGDQLLAEDLLATALADVPDKQRLATTLAAVDYLWNTQQQARADAMMQPLLADKDYAQHAQLWRLAAALANGRGMLARAISCQEQALDIEYRQLPAVVNVQEIRGDYGALLACYQQLADAVATLHTQPPRDFVTKVVRAADRWRAIDPDNTAACQAAARVLQHLGAADLAWDYLTTPLAERSNEAQPWQNLAQALRQEGEIALAERAYATAFELEPTNAQMLWERAMLLQQSNRPEEAKPLFRQLAEGKWEPRFNSIQSEAARHVKGQ
jgi:tetratricopeptide (TPR) repeat protein